MVPTRLTPKTNISKHEGVKPCTSSTSTKSLKGNNYEKKKVRVVIYACNTPLGHFPSILSKYFLAYGENGAYKANP